MNPPHSNRFKHFAAIDWSGAAGERHAGIALAICPSGDAAPKLSRPGHRWSRGEVLDWLLGDLPPDALISAAWPRTIAHDQAMWSPPLLTSQIAATGGWTFGVR